MEAKRQLNLKMDGKNEWRVNTTVAIKQNDTNTTYGMRYLLNHQLPTVETPGKEHLDISSVSYSVLLGHCQLRSILWTGSSMAILMLLIQLLLCVI